MKGATPVPGPIITMGWSGSVGRWNEFLRRQKIGTCMSVCVCGGRLSCLAMLYSISRINLVCQLKVCIYTLYVQADTCTRYVCEIAIS